MFAEYSLVNANHYSSVCKSCIFYDCSYHFAATFLPVLEVSYKRRNNKTNPVPIFISQLLRKYVFAKVTDRYHTFKKEISKIIIFQI